MDTLRAPVTSSTRLLLGIVSIVLLLAGAALALWGSDTFTAEIILRVGLVTGAWWLVAPLIRRPGWAAVVMLVIGVLVLVRVRLVIPMLVGAVIWRWAKRRDRPARR